MEAQRDMQVCDRCGEEITSFCPSLPSLAAIAKVAADGPDAVLEKLLELEGGDRDRIKEYMHHRMYALCPKKVGICPYCGGELKTWRAQLCLHCHRSWHNQNPAS